MAPMIVEALSGKVFLIVTGASQGIGEQIAVNFGHLLSKESQVVLLARNLEGLKETASKLPQYLKVNYESIDLSVATADVLNGLLQKYLGADDVKKFDRAVIVHNAASVGDVTKTSVDLPDFDQLQKYYDLNVVGPIVLTSVFMKIFNDESMVERLVINITSLAAIEPMANMTLYCSGKAAREMYFKTLALEFPKVNVINYAPGPVETEMFDTLVKTAGSEQFRNQLKELREKKGVLTTEQTVNRLVLVLRDQKYKSGDHVDYYDQL